MVIKMLEKQSAACMIWRKLKVSKLSYSLHPLVIVWLSVIYLAKSSLYKGLFFCKSFKLSYWVLGLSILRSYCPDQIVLVQLNPEESFHKCSFKKSCSEILPNSQRSTCVEISFNKYCTILAACCFM